MSDTALSPSAAARGVTDESSSPDASGIYAGVFIMSLASLLLELGLTRLFSVILFYHFAFLAISIALLGLGAGGVYAYLKREVLSQHDTRALGAKLATANAVAVLLALEIVLHIPVAIRLTAFAFFKLTVIYLAAAVPFFITGLMFSVVFAREKRRVSALYGADLVGGAAACLAFVPLLNLIGGPNTVLAAAAGMALAAVFWAADPRARRRAAWLGVALAVLIGANHSSKLVDVVFTKGFSAKRRKIEFARWNALSRIEVNVPGDGGKWISIDSDASTAIMHSDPHHWAGSETEARMMSEPPSVANVLRPHGSFAIIGPGGGPDVLRALGSGSPEVTGIEINPLIANTLMRGKYADYSQHLYQLPQVHIHVGDGRSWIRNAPAQFDVVQMTLVDTWASTAAGAFALSENNLYTVEAFKEYFAHLKPDGLLAITRWEFKQPREALRVASVAMEALHQLGIADTRRHFVVVTRGPLLEDGVAVAVIAKKSPLTPDEEGTVVQHLASHGLSALYLPSLPGNNAYAGLIGSNDPHAFSRGYQFNVAPVTDNAPFFFFTMKPQQVWDRGFSKGIDWKVNVGVAVLLMVLAISVAAVLAFVLLPLWLRRVRPGQGTPLLYFIAVGLGYILVEIAFIQRFVLFLGHPTYAITVVVFLMLLASGMGSALSRRWLRDPLQVWLPLIVISAALVVYVEVLPPILSTFVGAPFAAKLLLSGLLLAPLGLVMGMPFPAGLRALHGANVDTVEWAWALNAASSVLGSVLAMVLAIQFGLQVVLLCGVTAYVGAALLSASFRRAAVLN